MHETNANAIIPVLKQYPIREDGAINLSRAALRAMGVSPGTACRIVINKAERRFEVYPIGDGSDNDSTQNGAAA